MKDLIKVIESEFLYKMPLSVSSVANKIKEGIFFNHIRKVICGRDLKGIRRPRPVGPARFSLTMTFKSLGNVSYSLRWLNARLELRMYG